jgi:hypothetical protein
MCKRGGTHELVRAKDGFAEGGELDGRDGDFPDAVVLHAGPAEGPCDDLVAKADAWMGVGWVGMGRRGGLPKSFKDGVSATMRATYATSVLIHATSS